MRQVLIYVDQDISIDQMEQPLTRFVTADDEIYLIIKLSKVNNSSIPLIGDLKEIRYNKALSKWYKWYQELPIKARSFKPYIFEGKDTLNSLMDELNKKDEVVIFGLDDFESKLKSVFKLLEDYKNLSFILVDSQGEF